MAAYKRLLFKTAKKSTAFFIKLAVIKMVVEKR